MERWADIGPLLKAARSDLKTGQLIHGEAFSLFEAMSALEAGNPKMDAAASPSAESPSLEALLSDPTAAPWDLPLPTLLAVLDQLLAMEASWHSGGSAIQTVYACLYMLKLNRPTDLTSVAARALYAYCRMLQYDCAAVRDLVMSGGVCEEEDINVFTSGIPFEAPAGSEASAAALAALDAAIDELLGSPPADPAAATTATADAAGGAPQAAAATANGGGGGGGTAASPARPPAEGAAASVDAEAVAWRLRLRRALHQGLRAVAASEPKDVSAATTHFVDAQAALAKVRSSLSASLPPRSTSASSSDSTDSGASGGSAATGGSSGSSAQLQLAPGFQININRHLLGPAPPRQVKILSAAESWSYFERMLEHMQVAVAVPEHVHDYRSLQLYLWRFSRMRPGALARSLMHWLVMPERWQKGRTARLGRLGGRGRGGGAGAADGKVDQQSKQPGEELSDSRPIVEQQQQQQPQAETEAAEQGAAAAAAAVEGTGAGPRKGGGKKGGGAGGRKGTAASSSRLGGPAGSSSTSSQQQQQQQQPAVPPWVPTKEMIAGACRVAYKQGMPEEAELFFDQAVIAVANVCQAMLMNRCRSRRRLRRCLDDWLNMYHHGYNADVVPAFRDHLRASGWKWRPLEGQSPDDEQGPLSTWVEGQTCATMLHHLLMGFELELYEPLEYDMIYWYCDYLCTCMVGTFSAILQRCPPPQPPKQAQQGGLGRGRGLGRGLGGGRDPAAAAAAMARFEKEQNQLRYEVVEVEALQQLCQGMLRLFVGLKLAGAVPEPRNPPPFNSGAQRFEQRFAAFAPLLRPPPLVYGDYLTSMDPGGKDAGHLMALAGMSFREARIRCATLKGFAPSPDVAAGWVHGMERVAALNAVVAGVMAHKINMEGGKPLKWNCDWAHHPYVPAIALPKAAVSAPPAAASAPATATSTAASSTTSSSKESDTTAA